MKITKAVFAAPFTALFIGALLQPVGAQTYGYTRTITSYDSPTVIERTVDSPVEIDDLAPPMIIERPVILDNPGLVEEPIVVRHPHHAFHLGLFPLGSLNLF